MKTLNLTLKKEWFSLIESGQKKEEYREIKSYWMNRFIEKDSLHNESKESLLQIIESNTDSIILKKFDYVEFKNGYNKNCPQIKLECNGINISTGKTEWGALENQYYFVITLGKEINRFNIVS
jgi:hypothetical protein